MRSNLVDLLNTEKKCPWLVFHVLPTCLDPLPSLPEDYEGRLCHRDRGEESAHWTTSQGLLLSDSRPGKEVRNKPQKAAVFSNAVDSCKFGTLLLEKQMNKSDQPDKLPLSRCPCWRPDDGNAKEGNDGEVSSRNSGWLSKSGWSGCTLLEWSSVQPTCSQTPCISLWKWISRPFL